MSYIYAYNVSYGCPSAIRFIAQNIFFCTNELGEGLVKNLQNKRNAELKPKYNFLKIGIDRLHLLCRQYILYCT